MQAAIDTIRLADAQSLADKLVDLPKEALLYIAGYAEGCRDRPKDDMTDVPTAAQPPTNRPT